MLREMVLIKKRVQLALFTDSATNIRNVVSGISIILASVYPLGGTFFPKDNLSPFIYTEYFSDPIETLLEYPLFNYNDVPEG